MLTYTKEEIHMHPKISPFRPKSSFEVTKNSKAQTPIEWYLIFNVLAKEYYFFSFNFF